MIKRGDKLSDEVLEALEETKKKDIYRKQFDECLKNGICPNCGCDMTSKKKFLNVSILIYQCNCGFERVRNLSLPKPDPKLSDYHK